MRIQNRQTPKPYDDCIVMMIVLSCFLVLLIMRSGYSSRTFDLSERIPELVHEPSGQGIPRQPLACEACPCRLPHPLPASASVVGVPAITTITVAVVAVGAASVAAVRAVVATALATAHATVVATTIARTATAATSATVVAVVGIKTPHPGQRVLEKSEHLLDHLGHEGQHGNAHDDGVRSIDDRHARERGGVLRQRLLPQLLGPKRLRMMIIMMKRC